MKIKFGSTMLGASVLHILLRVFMYLIFLCGGFWTLESVANYFLYSGHGFLFDIYDLVFIFWQCAVWIFVWRKEFLSKKLAYLLPASAAILCVIVRFALGYYRPETAIAAFMSYIYVWMPTIIIWGVLMLVVKDRQRPCIGLSDGVSICLSSPHVIRLTGSIVFIVYAAFICEWYKGQLELLYYEDKYLDATIFAVWLVTFVFMAVWLF